jgi:hypothetical protein
MLFFTKKRRIKLMSIKYLTTSIIFLLSILFTENAQAKVTASDLTNLNNELKEIIASSDSGSPYFNMSLALYALETDNFEIYFYLTERDGFVIQYKSPLQESNVVTTTIFHTAVRKGNAMLLEELLDRCATSNSVHEYSFSSLTKNKAEQSFNVLGLALLADYINYDIVKTILEHGINPNSWRCQNNQDVRSNNTMIYPAFMFDRLDILELLMQYGAQVNVGNTQLLNEYIKRQHIEGVRLLISYGENVNWGHLDLALKFNTNSKGEEITLLLFEVYDKKT